MAINLTTLTSAVAGGTTGPTTDYTLAVASVTGITAPNFTSGVGITWLLIDQEFMLVTGVNGLILNVMRGQGGTAAVAHVNGSLVTAGLPGDFPEFGEFLRASMTSSQTEAALNWPAIFLAGSADALTGASGNFVIKTAGVDAVTLATPVASQEGNVVIIYSDTANAHTVTCPTTNFAVGAAANKTVCTFPARPGAGIALRVCNGNYHLLWTSGTGTNSGPVVWT